jgi:L-alanine-DL-glutamate epimerase-like enolase superfamily enzyme
MTRIANLAAEPLDIELSEPFGIATGAQLQANNVLVRLELDDGSAGLGEAAPFPAVSGETQQLVLETLHTMRNDFVGLPADRLRSVSAVLRESLSGVPSALCAVETALFDAFCRRAGLSLWSFFGGTDPELETDITIVTGSVEQACAAAERATALGFGTLKIKIGGGTLDHDAARVTGVAETAPHARLLLDANCGLSAEQSIEFASVLGPVKQRIEIFEQPALAGDVDGFCRVRNETGLCVAADESARSARDVARLAVARAADVINIKIMKSGISEALDMIACARAHGLGLMIGGMVESKLAMTVSACLAAGQGGFLIADLDTPLFMRNAPLQGGFEQCGPRLRLDRIERGHGVTLIA